MITLLIVITAGLLTWFIVEHHYRKTAPMAGGLHGDITLAHTQEWELYHNDFSLCSKKTRVCLAELGIEYKSHHIDLIETGSYENISRHFLKVNPAALVPVLLHNGHPIYESHDQLSYAAAHSSQPELLVPSSAYEKILMQWWVHNTSLIGDDPISGIDKTLGNAVPGLTIPIFATMIEAIPASRSTEGLLFHRFKQRAVFFLLLKLMGPLRLYKLKPLLAVISKSRRAMHRHLDQLEAQLNVEAGPWIIGDQFTLADVGIMVILDRLREGDWLDEFINSERPLLQRYWQNLQARDSFVSALMAHNHPTVERGLARIVELKQHHSTFKAILTGLL